jgi:hypothetical protein
VCRSPYVCRQRSRPGHLTHSCQCERCRKRKIKCSGNEGDSKACINCKNSGHQESCHFLRASPDSFPSCSNHTDNKQVQSFVASQIGYRDNYASHRYSPYPLPSHHRTSYMPMPSRAGPPSTLQYHALPGSVEYNPYTHQSTTVDWRQTYSPAVGPYSPYPEDEDSSPYTAQPPSYMLPNTDPMSTTSSYYMHGHGVRPHPGTLWSETPQYLAQPASQLAGIPYSMPSETSQPFQLLGAGLNLTSDRLLPQPITTRSYMPTPAPSIDVPIPTAGGRHHNYWGSETTETAQQLPTPMEPSSNQAQALSRESIPYRLQDLPYGQTAVGERVAANSLPSSSYLSSNEPQSVSRTATADEAPAHQTGLDISAPQPQKSNTDGASISYNYLNSLSSSQLQNGSLHLRPGPLFCQTEMLPRRSSGTGSEECSPDCTSSQTESTRTSLTSMTSTSASC